MFETPEFRAPPECPVCLKALQHSYGCRDDRTIRFEDGEVRDPVVYGEEERFQPFVSQPVKPCDRCGAMPGHYHHSGCPEEECPKCGEQYQSCGCSTDEKLRVSNTWMKSEEARRPR